MNCYLLFADYYLLLPHMRIGILGGSFNPPHLGHVLAAQQVLDFTDIEEVWFLPAFKHTFDKPLAPVSDRVAMTKFLKMPHTQVSTIEIDHELNGDTINLLPILKKEYPSDNFTFIIGSDQLAAFVEWGSWQELIKQIPFLVVPRAGYPLEPWYEGMTALVHKFFISTNISSSIVRARIAQKLSIDHLVMQTVKDYIVKKNLYQ